MKLHYFECRKCRLRVFSSLERWEEDKLALEKMGHELFIDSLSVSDEQISRKIGLGLFGGMAQLKKDKIFTCRKQQELNISFIAQGYEFIESEHAWRRKR